jgi:glycosyltransferase involved in cell wall biosynthesis
MKPPLVGVVVRTYNRAGTVCRATDSVLEQTYKNLEVIIIVNDSMGGSQGNTEAIVRQISRESVLPLRYPKQENLAISAARNHAIREAKAELILFCDDDIIPSPGVAAKHVTWHNRYPDPGVGVLVKPISNALDCQPRDSQ